MRKVYKRHDNLCRAARVARREERRWENRHDRHNAKQHVYRVLNGMEEES